MICLGIESAGKTAGVAIWKEDEPLYEATLSAGFTHSESLLEMIQTALTAARAVDLVAGALKERFGPEDLERCAEKIRAHTAVKSRERGEQSGKTVSFSHIC